MLPLGCRIAKQIAAGADVEKHIASANDLGRAAGPIGRSDEYLTDPPASRNESLRDDQQV